MTSLILPKPDDWHVHLRDGEILKNVLKFTAQSFARAIVMPNLRPPVTTTRLAEEYRQRILESLPAGSDFSPLMTTYLTDNTDAKDLRQGINRGVITAAKLYPAHATTNSDAGVTRIDNIYPALQTLSETGRPLLVHAEDASPAVDVFDREKVFIENILVPLVRKFPDLKIVVEHITTREAIDFVFKHRSHVAATITPHHLVLNRNAMFQGGLRPHAYCLPVAKREAHRLALVEAATSGEACFFLGTDSAPHTRSAKESDCGCAGIFSSPTALAVYAEVFAEAGKLTLFTDFASHFGPKFYGLPINQKKIQLIRKSWTPESEVLGMGAENIRVFQGGSALIWSVENL